MVATHFSGNTIKIGAFEDFEKKKNDFLNKNGGTTSCPFSRQPKNWVLLSFWAFFCFFFFLFLLHLARGCSKTPYFIGFFAHPSKASSDIMQQQGSKAKTPPKKGALFSLFWPTFFSKTLILHHPLKTVHQKISKKPYFYRLKKKWPSYWPYRGQVIDPTLAKMWPSYWPHSIYIYIYMYVYTYPIQGLVILVRNGPERKKKAVPASNSIPAVLASHISICKDVWLF